MTIKLINPQERFKHTIDGAVFEYRRLPLGERERLVTEHSKRGHLNDVAFSKAAFLWCLLGWEGIEDAAGEPAPFSHEAALTLPDQVMSELIGSMLKSIGGEQVADGPFA